MCNRHISHSCSLVSHLPQALIKCATSTRAIFYHTWHMWILSGDPAHGQRVTGLSAYRTMLLASSLVGIEDASATAMRRELGWPTLASRRALAESRMVHRCVTGCAPQYLASLFVQSTRVHLHNTRSAATGGILVPKVKSEFGRRSFAFWGCWQWNAFTPSLRSIKNPTSFVTVARSDLLKYT